MSESRKIDDVRHPPQHRTLKSHTKKTTALLADAFKKLQVASHKALRVALAPKNRRKTFISASVLVAVIVPVFALLQGNSNPQVLGDNLPEEPTYNTLIPNDEVSNTTSKKIAYDRQRQVVSYTDEIGKAQVTISQQPLPENFKSDTSGELAKLAKDIGAGEELKTDTITAYTTQYTDGVQTVVFVKNQVLVFINSSEELAVLEVSGYIDSLQ
jgi:hypothetical protein